MAVISYDTQAWALIQKFVASEGIDNKVIIRVDPKDFLANPQACYQYINLVVLDWEERFRISQTLDQHNLDRWTYIGEPSTYQFFQNLSLTVGPGCVLFPAVWAYQGSIGKDTIVHSLVRIAENVSIGNGCYISGSVTIAGSCTIGDRCYLGNNLFMIDHVNLCDDVRLLPGTNLRKSVTVSGTYYNPNTYRIEKLTT